MNPRKETMQHRVLIVDDDVTSAALLQAILEDTGLEVLTAHNGAQGRRLAHETIPDVIILDVNMPGEDGIQVCKKLKQDALTQSIPVIFITVVQDVAAKIAGFHAGGSDYLTKPYEPGEVLARVNLQISLRQSEQTVALQAVALDEAKELITIVDTDCRILVANKSCEIETGQLKGALIGQDISILAGDGSFPDVYNQLRESIASGRSWKGELQMQRHDGSNCFLDVSATVFSDKSLARSFVVMVARDITDSRMHRNELERQARHDFLTGLLNRKGFIEQLSYLAGHRHQSRYDLALLYVDLDKFKLVNDTLGHTVGDALLVQAASRLNSCVRDSDVAARIGGDEFAVLLKGQKISTRAEAVAGRILSSLDGPINVCGHELAVSASIGISIGLGDAWDPDSLIRDADTAMYAAKQSGRNCFISYSDAENAEAVAVAELKRDLFLAVGRNEFEVYYQPIVDAETLRTTGAEALLRWNHPIKGLVSPGVFIPIAEEIGLMNDIGDYVLREACSTAGKWKSLTPITIAANISPCQLSDADFPMRVERIMAEASLDPGMLCLELTEQETTDLTPIRNLSRLGLGAAVDYFRADVPIPEWLKHFASAHLKVDGALLRRAIEDPTERRNIENIVEAAHTLGIKVTAEWVETQDQIDLVRNIGFDFVQGYAISPPVKGSALAKFLKDDSDYLSLDNAA